MANSPICGSLTYTDRALFDSDAVGMASFRVSTGAQESFRLPSR